MAKDSRYFERLRCKGRYIDAGIEKLSEAWRMPDLLMGGYGERTAETDACLEQLWESVRSTDAAVEKLKSDLKPSLDETDRLLEESQAEYEDLKAQCNDLDIVLAEYGYRYEENNGGSEDHSRNSSNDATGSFLTTEGMPDVEVEFTPDLSWKCKARSKDSDSFNANRRNPIVKSIATPVIKSLESALHSESLNKTGSLVRNASVQKSNGSKQITRVSRR
ncbi:PREDICTED: uncharacterized protein LOC105569879 [Vollenhovia emeryi]|uniref:uncharacterized protein LOC105569879 n=1 Tax=Vollenhovia emeryi TaxID=411798 RepID=UPI0005F43D99|nr:PREDICTED: uncharacterized protein LOC105569879 [Vollenhovia emeryi]